MIKNINLKKKKITKVSNKQNKKLKKETKRDITQHYPFKPFYNDTRTDTNNDLIKHINKWFFKRKILKETNQRKKQTKRKRRKKETLHNTTPLNFSKMTLVQTLLIINLIHNINNWFFNVKKDNFCVIYLFYYVNFDC